MKNNSYRSISEIIGYDIYMTCLLLTIIIASDVILFYISGFTSINALLIFVGSFDVLSVVLFVAFIIGCHKAKSSPYISPPCLLLLGSYSMELLSMLLIIIQALLSAVFFPLLESVNTANLTNTTTRTIIFQAKIGVSVTYIVVLAAIFPLKILYLNVLMNIGSRVKRFCP